MSRVVPVLALLTLVGTTNALKIGTGSAQRGPWQYGFLMPPTMPAMPPPPPQAPQWGMPAPQWGMPPAQYGMPAPQGMPGAAPQWGMPAAPQWGMPAPQQLAIPKRWPNVSGHAIRESMDTMHDLLVGTLENAAFTLKKATETMNQMIEKLPVDEETGLIVEVTEETKDKFLKDMNQRIDEKWKELHPHGIPKYVNTEFMKKTVNEVTQKVLESSVCDEDILREVSPPDKCGSPRYVSTEATMMASKITWGGTAVLDFMAKSGEFSQWLHSRTVEALKRLKGGEGPDGVRQLVAVGFPAYHAKQFNVPALADSVADAVEKILVEHQSKSVKRRE